MAIAYWKSRTLFLIPQGVFDHLKLSNSCCLIHELFPTNLLSFQELVNFGTPYLPLPFLNPTTYLASNPTSINLISSFHLLNFPFSFFLCQGLGIGSMALSTKKRGSVQRLPFTSILYFKSSFLISQTLSRLRD